MNAPEEQLESSADAIRELLSFRVADTEFAFPVHSLCEVIELVEIMRVQADLISAEGIINYRGTVIPVVDTRKALGLELRPLAADCHIIVTDAGGERTGLIVDDVHDVLTVPEATIERPGARVPLGRFVSGIAKLDGRLLLILDIEALLASPAAQQAAEPAIPAAETTPLDDEVRELLRKRALELSKPVEQPDADRGTMVTTVCFSMRKGAYALRAEFAKEIVIPPIITAIPCAPPYVMGAVNIRGAIVPVLELATFLGLQHDGETAPEETRIIVAEVDGVVVGLLVDEVLGVCEVSSREIIAPLDAIESDSVGFIDGEFDHHGRAVCTIDAPAIIKVLEDREGGDGATRQETRSEAPPPSRG